MLPGITEHQARLRAPGRRGAVVRGRRLVHPAGAQPRGRRGDRPRARSQRRRRDRDRDAHLRARRCARCARCSRPPVPLLLANIQPETVVTPEWDMDDLTYNQGIHGAQDQANALVRAGIPFSVITGDWRSPEFEAAFEDWARAARSITALKRTRIALLGYPMNGMGDIRYDPAALLRRLGPVVENVDLGELVARVGAVSEARGRRRARSPRRGVRGLARAAARAPRVRRPARGRDPRRCSRTAATRASRSTSTRSGATAGSSSCRCWRRRT